MPPAIRRRRDLGRGKPSFNIDQRLGMGKGRIETLSAREVIPTEALPTIGPQP